MSARIQRKGNVRAIRPGLPIPIQREEDHVCIINARLAERFLQQSYELAQTEPNSEKHLLALHMAGMARQLPCNNLRLLLTPDSPRREWFDEAAQRVRVARAEHDLIESRWSLAFHLDRQDGGHRRHSSDVDRSKSRAALDQAIEDALRVPTVRKHDVQRKQDMIGKREWAEKYRPDWQAMVDEDLARYPSRSRKSAGGAA